MIFSYTIINNTIKNRKNQETYYEANPKVLNFKIIYMRTHRHIDLLTTKFTL